MFESYVLILEQRKKRKEEEKRRKKGACLKVLPVGMLTIGLLVI